MVAIKQTQQDATQANSKIVSTITFVLQNTRVLRWFLSIRRIENKWDSMKKRAQISKEDVEQQKCIIPQTCHSNTDNKFKLKW